MEPILIHVFQKVSDPSQVLADYGVEMHSGQMVMLPTCTPAALGAVFDEKLKHWVIWSPVAI